MTAMALNFSGEVTAVIFAPNGIRMLMYPDGEVGKDQGDEVDVSTTVTVTGPLQFDFDPEHATDVAVHVASRLLQPIKLSVRADGALVLSFGDHYEWVCPPNEQYEAWTAAADGARWISLPGGELAIISEPSTDSVEPQV